MPQRSPYVANEIPDDLLKLFNTNIRHLLSNVRFLTSFRYLSNE